MRSPARCSVVIPAHDEAAVLGACLEPLRDLVGRSLIEVVVVANGCVDDTTEVAAAVPGVRVVEVAVASKVAALNAGDAAAGTLPRIYLDADVVLSADALLALADALSVGEAIAGSVGVNFVTEGRPWLVRAFYRAYERTPYVVEGLVGLGLYGLSAAGRARFAAFPDLVADDLFVQRLFAPDQRVVLTGHRFDVQTPRTAAALLAVRTRSASGAAQLAAAGDGSRTTSSTVATLLRLAVREPRRAPDVAVYLAFSALARRRGRRAASQAWQRDSTTR